MSLPPRYDRAEFPAAAVGPSIDTASSAVPSSLMQGLARSSIRTTTSTLSQNKRNAPLLMAG